MSAGFYAKLLTSFLQVLIQHFFYLILPKGINRRFAKIETYSFSELSLNHWMICEGLELPPEIVAKFAGTQAVTTWSTPPTRDDCATTVQLWGLRLRMCWCSSPCLQKLSVFSLCFVILLFLRLLSFAFLFPARLSLTELSVGCVCVCVCNLTHALCN